MSKFWEWMKKNKYSWDSWNGGKGEHGILHFIYESNSEDPHSFTKQMLIGYMIEYLTIENPMFDTLCLSDNIEDLYNELVDKIESL